jgi:hypothetical protein
MPKDELLAKLKPLIATLAMIHEKLEQGVYDTNKELLHDDLNTYEDQDMEFGEAAVEYATTRL